MVGADCGRAALLVVMRPGVSSQLGARWAQVVSVEWLVRWLRLVTLGLKKVTEYHHDPNPGFLSRDTKGSLSHSIKHANPQQTQHSNFPDTISEIVRKNLTTRPGDALLVSAHCADEGHHKQSDSQKGQADEAPDWIPDAPARIRWSPLLET